MLIVVPGVAFYIRYRMARSLITHAASAASETLVHLNAQNTTAGAATTIPHIPPNSEMQFQGNQPGTYYTHSGNPYGYAKAPNDHPDANGSEASHYYNHPPESHAPASLVSLFASFLLSLRTSWSFIELMQTLFVFSLPFHCPCTKQAAIRGVRLLIWQSSS